MTMGQATAPANAPGNAVPSPKSDAGGTADLPDPLHPSAAHSSAPASATDDLLSQLAGDEIDRMLAQSDAEGGVPRRHDFGQPPVPQIESASPAVVAAAASQQAVIGRDAAPPVATEP